METIKRLPENVRSTVRSGFVLFDLSRVVEELILNSLDAGAGKEINRFIFASKTLIEQPLVSVEY